MTAAPKLTLFNTVVVVSLLIAPVAPQCVICPDGTKNLAFPDRIVPFFNLDGGNANPSCQQLADAAEAADSRMVDCDLVKAQAGYCGCDGVQPEQKCSFCPDGAEPANKDLVAPSTDVCGDLYTYAEYLSEEDCGSRRFNSMQGLAYICGCPGVKAQCSLCPDGSPPPLLDKEAQPTGETCSEMALIIEAFTADVCVDSDTTVLVSAARCGCADSKFPVCSVQQNTHLCTHELLDTVPDQDCECHSFCDGEWVQCHNFPGGLLNSQVCTGVPVSGCNRASATGQNTSAATSATQLGTSSIITIAFAVGSALILFTNIMYS